jgi:hypothetical protein
MKRLLSVIAILSLVLCLMGCMTASAEEVDNDSFLLRIWDESGLTVSYLRFDTYVGESYTGLVCSSPNEGEDFYRFPYSVDSSEELKDLRVEISYGISDLPSEDAILQVMMGNPAEEHKLLTLDFVPECGKIYDMKLVSGGEDGWLLVPAEE